MNSKLQYSVIGCEGQDTLNIRVMVEERIKNIEQELYEVDYSGNHL